jgi:hypothetical protein
MSSLDERDPEEVRLGRVRTPRTVDPFAALVGGAAGAAVVVAVWLSSVPVQAVFLEGPVAGLVAGSVDENTKVPALDGAAATVVGGVLGLLAVCVWLVANLSLSTGLELQLFLSLFGAGLSVLVLAASLAVIPGAIAASLAYRVRRAMGWL